MININANVEKEPESEQNKILQQYSGLPTTDGVETDNQNPAVLILAEKSGVAHLSTTFEAANFMEIDNQGSANRLCTGLSVQSSPSTSRIESEQNNTIQQGYPFHQSGNVVATVDQKSTTPLKVNHSPENVQIARRNSKLSTEYLPTILENEFETHQM